MAVVCCLPLGAATLTLTFRIDVDSAIQEIDGEPLGGFIPFEALLTAVFDTGVTSTSDSAMGPVVQYGSPTILSPITAYLPYGPNPIAPSPDQRAAAAYILGDPLFHLSQTHFDFVVATQRNFAYNFSIDIPLPGMPSDDIRAYLRYALEQASPISFYEGTSEYDGASGSFVGGASYYGSGTLVDISTPEPGSSLLTAFGLGGMLAFAFYFRTTAATTISSRRRTPSSTPTGPSEN
jgi:hypothetical protein